jgi:hypothetical protein
VTPQDITDQLEHIASDQDFLAESAELTDAWSSAGAGVETVEPTLRFMEDHPNIEYGTPGPLVHFVERFYQHGYEERLLESVQRKPTAPTIWMLNRVINGTKEPEVRRRLVAAMEAARVNPLADQNARQMADRFVERLAH